MQSSGETRWLVAQYAPSQVWVAARQFFTDNGFSIAEERRQTGEFVTAWQTAADLNDELVRDLGIQDGETRVRVRVEPGVQRNTSEIFVVSVKRPTGSSADVAWPETSSNKELDRVLLDELQASLDRSSQQGGSVSLLAERDFDAARMAGHGLVHGVVDNFRGQVVQGAFIRAADVHAGAASDGLQAFQNLDVLGGIFTVARGLGGLGRFCHGGLRRCLIRLLFVLGVLK